jgi:hypothetical protein
MKPPFFRHLAVPAAAMVMMLGACGGGSSTPAAQVPAATPAPTLPATPEPVTTPVTVPVTTPAPPASAPLPTPAPWKPALTDTWQWQLTGSVNTSYAATIYDIDLFDSSIATIGALHGAGKKVICYFSAGSAESWRTDFGNFATTDMGSALDGWTGERWLDTGSANVRAIMRQRLDLAQSKGCDGVEPDNVDGYSNKTDFALTEATQLNYNRFLATEAHRRGLVIALKNDVDQLAELVDDFDFAVNEQCHQYDECGAYKVFIAAGKPVFNAEYAKIYRTAGSDRDALCVASKKLGLKTLVLGLELNDAFRFSCDE